MNETIKQTYAGDLGALVFSERRTGAPTVEAEKRGPVCAALESVLANVNDFDAHYALLNRHYHGHFPFAETLSAVQTEAVLKEGLQALDDATLAQLALNPVALYRLSEQICEQFPQAWWDVLRREGSRLRQDASAAGPSPGMEVGAQEELAWLSTVPVPEAVRPAVFPRHIGWEWDIAAADCIWQLGDRSKVGEQTARITAAWSAGGHLTVAVAGFLSPGKEQTLEVVWTRVAGGTLLKGRSEGNVEPVRIAEADGGPPRSGDRLKVRRLARPAQDADQAWDVSFVVAF